jgi:DNA polymerase III epsilon subunit-like protein
MTRLFVIDTETGGLDPEKYSLLTLAGAVWDDGQILETIEISVQEVSLSVEPEAMMVNRIDLAEHERWAISPVQAVRLLDEFLDRHFAPHSVTLAGHNVGFDVGFLRRLYRLALESYPERFSRRNIDTASILGFLNLCGIIKLEKPSLDNAIKIFNIPHDFRLRHTAIGDVLLTCELLNRMKDLVLHGVQQ